MQELSQIPLHCFSLKNIRQSIVITTRSIDESGPVSNSNFSQTLLSCKTKDRNNLEFVKVYSQ